MLPSEERAAAKRIWPGPGDLLSSLAGRWRLVREIEAQGLAGSGGRLEGFAVFQAGEDGCLDYQEDGAFQLAEGTVLQASRRYRFRPKELGFAVDFLGPQRGLFHEVRLAARSGGLLLGRARHLCSADLYLSLYAFLPDGSFVIRHRVKGPRKAYRMTGRYLRLD